MSPGGQKPRAVVVMLLASVGMRVPGNRLVEPVYGDPGAGRRLRTYVSTLRSVVGDVAVKDGRGWRLAVERHPMRQLFIDQIHAEAKGLDG